MNMNFRDLQEAKERIKEETERALRKQNHVASLLDEEALAYIAEFFSCNEVSFQHKDGGYDPLDAMRRDAYRDVYLNLRKWRRRWKKANN